MGANKWRGLLLQFLLCLLIAAGFTAIVLRFSLRHGKLLCPPTYDDVAYFEDALHRLAVLYKGGLFSLIKDYHAYPPHSVFSSYLAMTAFAIAGVRDWAPYAANGLAILCLLLSIDLLTRDLPLPARIALMLLVLCIPISMRAVYEFRPDIPSAMCVAIASAMLFWRPFTQAPRSWLICAGTLAGLALLFKPPTSPLTAAVFFSSLLLAFALQRLTASTSWKPLLTAAIWCALPAILIPLPHYLLT